MNPNVLDGDLLDCISYAKTHQICVSRIWYACVHVCILCACVLRTCARVCCRLHLMCTVIQIVCDVCVCYIQVVPGMCLCDLFNLYLVHLFDQKLQM